MGSANLLDAATHVECLEFIRAAIAEADRQTAQDVAGILKDCYQNGYVDRAEIWADLTRTEKQQFQELLGPIAHHSANRIKQAIGWSSPGVALGISCDLESATVGNCRRRMLWRLSAIGTS